MDKQISKMQKSSESMEKELEELKKETEKRALEAAEGDTAEAGKTGKQKKTACLLKPEKMPGMPMIQQRYPPQNRGVTEEK